MGKTMELLKAQKKAQTLTANELIEAWKYYHNHFNPLDNSADYIEIIEEEMLSRMKKNR